MATNFSGKVVSTAGFTGDITGDVTGNLTGLALQGGSATAISTAGAIPITTLLSVVENDGTAIALTLANGAAGQMKFIKYNDGTSTGDAVVTPANFADGSTITLNADGEGIVLVSDGSSWHAVPGYTATVA